MPSDIGWAEALHLVGILRRDPSSALASAMEGWDFPISREALAIYDLFDLTVMANTDPKKPRPKPHSGRPFKPAATSRVRRGDAAGRTPEQVKALLAEKFGQPEAPV